MHVFALTGGIGSGKSTVAEHFRSQGLPVVDADVLAREVVAPGTEGLAEIAAEFGPEVLTSEGALDRKRLGQIVFADAGARAALERIVHPRVRQAAQDAWSKLAGQGVPLACYEVPLLFETGQAEAYRPVVVVHVRPETQIARVMARDGVDRTTALSRIDAQLPLAEKAARADFVIDNDGPRERTLEAASRVLATLRERYGRA